MIIKNFIYILHSNYDHKENLIKKIESSDINIVDKNNTIHYVNQLSPYILNKNYEKIDLDLLSFLNELKKETDLHIRACKTEEFFKCHDYLQKTHATTKVEESLEKKRKYLLHILYVFIKNLLLFIIGLIFIQFFLQIINTHDKNKYSTLHMHSK